MYLFFKTAFLILNDLEFLSEITKGLTISGALGLNWHSQRARILSPLCLPISPRGLELFSWVFMLIFIIEQVL